MLKLYHEYNYLKHKIQNLNNDKGYNMFIILIAKLLIIKVFL